MKNRIGVVPLGEVPKMAVKVIAANITAYYNWQTDILPAQVVPAFAYDEVRFKYNAGTIINRLNDLAFKDYSKVMGVMSHDLFIPIFNYVYGQAVQGGSHALISLFRLGSNSDGSTPPLSRYYERAAKVALHELGHLFNLFHCNEKHCIMHFTGGVDDLDNIPFHLCIDCQNRLRP